MPCSPDKHAADLDAKPQNVGAEGFGLLEFAVLHGVEDDQGMQIAVAGMKDIAEAQLIVSATASPSLPAPAAGHGAGMVPSMQIMSGASRPMAAKAALRPDQMRGALLLVGGFHRRAAALARRCR